MRRPSGRGRRSAAYGSSLDDISPDPKRNPIHTSHSHFEVQGDMPHVEVTGLELEARNRKLSDAFEANSITLFNLTMQD